MDRPVREVRRPGGAGRAGGQGAEADGFGGGGLLPDLIVTDADGNVLMPRRPAKPVAAPAELAASAAPGATAAVVEPPPAPGPDAAKAEPEPAAKAHRKNA